MRFGMLAAAAAACALAAPASALTYTGTITSFGQTVNLDFGYTGAGSYRIDYEFSAPVADIAIGAYVEETYNFFSPEGEYQGGNDVPIVYPEERNNALKGTVKFVVPRPYIHTYPDGSTEVGSYRFIDAYAAFYPLDDAAPVTYTIRTSVASSGVPEPATWALMILGFGAIGAATRTRRWRQSQPSALLVSAAGSPSSKSAFVRRI